MDIYFAVNDFAARLVSQLWKKSKKIWCK